MLVWFAIFFGILFALLGIKKKVYPMWAILINLMIAVFLGVMVTPTIIGLFEELRGSYYHYATFVISTSLLVFGLLQIIAISFFTSEYEVAFPKIFDFAGSAVFGFFVGYIAFSFIFFVVCILPFKKDSFMAQVCDNNSFGINAVQATCSVVNVACLKCYDSSSEVIEWLTSSRKVSPSNDQTELTKKSKEISEPNDLHSGIPVYVLQDQILTCQNPVVADNHEP